MLGSRVRKYILSKSELKEIGEKQGPKSDSKNQKWTKKMSNFQNPNDFMKKAFKFPPPHHNGLVHKKNH